MLVWTLLVSNMMLSHRYATGRNAIGALILGCGDRVDRQTSQMLYIRIGLYDWSLHRHSTPNAQEISSKVENDWMKDNGSSTTRSDLQRTSDKGAKREMDNLAH